MTIVHQTQYSTVHAGDCLDVLKDLPDESVHAVITDPPYGLSNTTPAQVTECLKEWATGNTTYTPSVPRKGRKNCLTEIISRSEGDVLNMYSVAQRDLVNVPITFHAGLFAVLGSVNLDDEVTVREEEVHDVSPRFALDDVLINDLLASLGERGKDVEFTLRAGEGSARCVGECSCFTELSHSRVSVGVRLGYYALTQADAAAPVVALRTTEVGAVLAFDVGGGAFELSLTAGALQDHAPTLVLRSKGVGASAGASSFPAVSEPGGVGNVDDAASGAMAIDLLSHVDLLDRFSRPNNTPVGFMGKDWDGFVPPPAVWEECLRVLKPGGHLLAFAGSRTQDLMGMSVRMAGFDVRDSFAWLYGSGFPKSMDVSKAIDKAAGAEREVIGVNPRAAQQTPKTDTTSLGAFAGTSPDLTTPATPEAQQWEGWGTALKPAHEPVIRAQKPFSVVPLEEEVNRLHHLLGGLLWLSLSPAKRAELTSPSSPAGQRGATCVSALVSAALNTSPVESDETATFSSPALASTSLNIASSWSATLDALSERTRTSTTSTKSSTTTGLRTLNSLLGPITSQTTMPRCGCLTSGSLSPAPSVASASSDEWAKWLHTLSASVPATATEGIALAVASVLADIAAQLSADAEEVSTAPASATTSQGANNEPVIMARKPFKGTVAANILEHGTGAINIDASRIPGTENTARAQGKSIRGGKWSGDGDRSDLVTGGGTVRFPANVLLDESQAAALDEQSGTSVSRSGGKAGPIGYHSGGSGAERGGHNDSGGASRFFYCAKAPKSERPKVDGVAHPTVKPLTLLRYLVRMVTPPGGTVLDPFTGSGTTLEAATQEGFTNIGIEAHPDYLPLIAHRLERTPEPQETQPPLSDTAA